MKRCLALEELASALNEEERPDFWPLFWERYVENKLDYKCGIEVLKNKHCQAYPHHSRKPQGDKRDKNLVENYNQFQ